MRGEHKKRIPVPLAHLNKRVNAIIDLESRPSKKDIATLTNSTDHFNEHTALLKEVDQEIAYTITGKDELAAEIVESAATQEAIQTR